MADLIERQVAIDADKISHREATFTCRTIYINKELMCNILGITGYKRTEILFLKKKKRGSKRRRRKTE